MYNVNVLNIQAAVKQRSFLLRRLSPETVKLSAHASCTRADLSVYGNGLRDNIRRPAREKEAAVYERTRAA